MRNIVNIDCNNTSCYGASYFNTNTNELIVSIVPKTSQQTNLTLYVIDPKNVVRIIKLDKLNSAVIPIECWNSEGLMMVQLRSDEGNSDYIRFNTKAFSNNDDVYVTCVANEFVMHLCEANDLPKLKRYDEKIVLNTSATSVTFTTGYSKVCDALDVYVNRLKLIEHEDYSVMDNTISFNQLLDSNSIVLVVVTKIE